MKEKLKDFYGKTVQTQGRQGVTENRKVNKLSKCCDTRFLFVQAHFTFDSWRICNSYVCPVFPVFLLSSSFRLVAYYYYYYY